MVSSFASQLQAIAKNSSNELDLRARRNAHGESLLFEREVAIKQDFQTIYNICNDGFRELCRLDDRFLDFDRNLFSEQSKDQDREQMTKDENEAFDLVLRRCLMLLGGRLLLKPALKALEWLVRRFRVHVHNVDDLLLTLVPYHEVAVWANVLSIIPDQKVVGQWKFVRPYLKTTWNLPRHAVAYAAAHQDAFFASISAYVLNACKQDLVSNHLMTFWSSLIVEAVSNRLDQTRSGRKEVQAQRIEDLLHKVLPLLSDGFETVGVADLITACYTITIVLVAKVQLGDNVLDSLLLAVAQSLSRADHDTRAAIVTMSVIVVHKEAAKVPKKVLEALVKLEVLGVTIRSLSDQHDFRPLVVALVSSAMGQIKRKNAHKVATFTGGLIKLYLDLNPSSPLAHVVKPVVAKILSLNPSNEIEDQIRSQLITALQHLNDSDAVATAISDAALQTDADPAVLEHLLGMTITTLTPEAYSDTADVDMLGTDMLQTPPRSLDLPIFWHDGTSCLAAEASPTFRKLGQAFESCFPDAVLLGQFMNHSFWSSTTDQRLLWQTFLIRFACMKASSQARCKALGLLRQELQQDSAYDPQILVPYLLTLLSDVKPVRKATSDLLTLILELVTGNSQQPKTSPVYNERSTKQITLLPHKQVASLLSDCIVPMLEECVLDQSCVVRIVQNNLNSHSSMASKKSHRQPIFTLLTQHALATPLTRVKVTIISMLNGVQKVGGRSKTKTLLPILQEWSELSEPNAVELVDEGGLVLKDVDSSFVTLTDVQDKQSFEHVVEAATSAGGTYRPGLINALFTYMRKDWSSWTPGEQFAATDSLFSSAFSNNEAVAAGSREVLRDVDIPSEALANLLHLSQAGTSEVRAPQHKKRKRSSSASSMTRLDAIKSVDHATSKIGLVLELVGGNLPELKPELIISMFGMLATLKQLQQNRVESPYLTNTCLDCIHAMATAANSKKTTLDASKIKPELVTDFLRTSGNPQVQNTSLLVLAALSNLVPDQMVHNVMPIFTFIGHNMLSKDDDHSINVINDAIDKIVPALLESLRKGRNLQAYQSSMASMLGSFTSAFNHIPPHRRVAFYQKLLSCIDAEEYGFMLVALLSDQQYDATNFSKFMQDLVGVLSASSQLKMYQQLLHLSTDTLATHPKLAAVIFDLGRQTILKAKHRHAESALHAALEILKTPSLVAEIRRVSKSGQDSADQVGDQLQHAFRATLATIQNLKGSSEAITPLSKQCMDNLLMLPSLSKLLQTLLSILDGMESELRPQALRILSLQMAQRKSRDARTRELALQLLEKLSEYVKSRSDVAMYQASLVCIDRISETHGRKNSDSVITAAEAIISSGLTYPDVPAKVEAATLLTLASMIEVLGEASVQLIPALVPGVDQVLSASVGDEHFSEIICSSSCTLLSAIFSNVAFMVSEESLGSLLTVLFASRDKLLSTKSGTDYIRLLQTIACKVGLDMLVDSVKLVGERVTDGQAVLAATLETLTYAIEASSKVIVLKHADQVSFLFQAAIKSNAIEMHNEVSQAGAVDISKLTTMAQLKDSMIKFIYKLNDTTFRPVFESWIDSPQDSRFISDNHLQACYQIVIFDLLAHFFDTLKGIVTSYASHLLKQVNTVLASSNTVLTTSFKNKSASRSKNSSNTSLHAVLLQQTLKLLRAMTSHDHDSFFATPSHFTPLHTNLISLLTLAATKSVRHTVLSQVLPTVTSLATATLDAPSTHSQLISAVVQLKSHGSSHVRLASIQTLLALSEDEEIGEEFIANVIGIGAGEGEGARGGGGSMGEIMVYVNEMLEDDDEEVEHSVRKWVQAVRAKVGEDVFEV